jgi:MOSC domain-containing protein
METAGQITGIYRYPVKGLSPESLGSVALVPGETLPADRMFAIENGPSGFDPAKPAYFPKLRFLRLMRNERLAELDTRFDEGTHTLTIRNGGREAVAGDLRTPAGRSAIEQFFAQFCAADLRGPPKVLQAPGHSFSDVARKVVSIINLASVAQVAQAIGAPVDPLRFRGNLYVEGWPAWREFDFLDRELRAGTAVRLRVVKRIVRCAATNVDPRTGTRDLAIPETLMRRFGHGDCGVYAEVIAGGTIAVADEISSGPELGLTRNPRAGA